MLNAKGIGTEMIARDNRLTTFSFDFFMPSLLGDSTPPVVWFSFFESGKGGEIDSRLRFVMAVN